VRRQGTVQATKHAVLGVQEVIVLEGISDRDDAERQRRHDQQRTRDEE